MKDDDAMTKDKELLQGDMLRVEDVMGAETSNIETAGDDKCIE